MAGNPVQLIVAAFQEEDGAKIALAQLEDAKKAKLIQIKDAAVLRKGADGKLHISETGDMTGTKGGVLGGVVGAGLGILTGGATLAIGAGGAVIGGLVAKLRDSGFKDERLRKLGEGLKPGSSTIVAVIEHTWVGAVEKELANMGADIVTEAISADIAEQLESGGGVAYTAIASEGGAAAARITTEDKPS